ncbi:hypothetical protein FHG87_007825 [Trinorchestia longiramus]|nr:hypothetical protein FHG87_007825 [Trinorchestia longiramus]
MQLEAVHRRILRTWRCWEDKFRDSLEEGGECFLTPVTVSVSWGNSTPLCRTAVSASLALLRCVAFYFSSNIAAATAPRYSKMEERTTGGSSKDKKYVLYTVVGDDRPRASPGALLTRVLLSCLLVVALAVVPYVSLRLAQANNRTLVVFQPVPLHNRSAVRRFHSTTKEVQLMQIADLKLENASRLYDNDTTTTIVPIELSTTLSPNGTLPIATSGLQNYTNFTTATTVVRTNLTTLEAETVVETDTGNTTNLSVTESSATETLIVVTRLSTNASDFTSFENHTLLFDVRNASSSPMPTVSTTEASNENSTVVTTQTRMPENISTETDLFLNLSTTYAPVTQKVLTTTSSASPETTTMKVTINSSPPTIDEKYSNDLKLAYVATSASGNHVGGICIFKSGNNVTDWSYFYENIPIELQSDHVNGDHELRAVLAAIRTWAPQWHDTHAVLRSSHAAIKESDLPLRQHIVDELESRSQGLFTYELEWRLPQGDPLVKTSSSLSHLHQDYKFWFQDFQNLVNDLIGIQEWKIAAREKHVKIDQGAFFDDESMNENSGLTEKPLKVTPETIIEAKTPEKISNQPPTHKLVYMATSASGNHVGGFCMWKIGRNVTNWSYFYDNVPVELQSNHDTEDHEVRAALAGVRVWADRWDGAHVSLRSQRSPLLRSHTATFFLQTLEVLSTSHFSYDLEWQLRKSDELVRISYSLSRLYRNFGHWFASFKASVDDVVGPQDWETAAKTKRIHLNDEHLFIDPIFPEAQPSEVTKTE